jgi:hypothetical protein
MQLCGYTYDEYDITTLREGTNKQIHFYSRVESSLLQMVQNK